MKQFRTNIKDEKDIHTLLMSRYCDIPHWWFAATFIISFILGAVTIEAYDTKMYDTKMPFWAYILTITLSLIFILPLGILLAITNQQLTQRLLRARCRLRHSRKTHRCYDLQGVRNYHGNYHDEHCHHDLLLRCCRRSTLGSQQYQGCLQGRPG